MIHPCFFFRMSLQPQFFGFPRSLRPAPPPSEPLPGNSATNSKAAGVAFGRRWSKKNGGFHPRKLVDFSTFTEKHGGFNIGDIWLIWQLLESIWYMTRSPHQPYQSNKTNFTTVTIGISPENLRDFTFRQAGQSKPVGPAMLCGGVNGQNQKYIQLFPYMVTIVIN